MGNTYETILKRRSTRKFTSKPIEKSEIDLILKAAMAAPSAGNQQPWHFVVVDDRKILDQLSEVHNYAKMLLSAPLCIAVCGEVYRDRPVNVFWDQDCSAATQNILLEAEELGLGSVWLGIYPNEVPRTRVKRILNLPDHIIPFCLIVIGHKAEDKEAKTWYQESKVHYNQWQ